MAAIQHEDMILVYGNGTTRTGEELLRDARANRIVYERHVEDPGTQTVRMYGKHTAVVTARLSVDVALCHRAAEERHDRSRPEISEGRGNRPNLTET
jgi:hypothetical protein